jgi:N utilization substance protein B
MLFAIDAAGHPSTRVIEDFWREFPGDAEGRAYADDLTKEISANKTTLDEHITKVSANWKIERMTRVDRNILRLGLFELLHRADVPRAVIIDEAVELAKRYGADNSASFVNGVLDKLADVCRGAEPG